MIPELNDFYRNHQEIMIDGVLTRNFDSNPQSKQLPIVIALHGVALSSFYFRRLMTLFDERVRLIVPDLPGFGRSAKRLPWAAKPKQYLRWLDGFVNSLVPEVQEV